MKTLSGLGALAFAIFLAFPLQEILPPVSALHGARILLVPALFCYGAVSLPTTAMLALAVLTGLLSDLSYLHVVGGQVEIGMGWSIVFFVIFGLISNGFQPAFQRGQWWIPAPLGMLATSLFLLLQFGMITLRRGGFEFNEVAAWRILGPGLMAGAVAPFIHLFAIWGGSFFGTPVKRHRVSLAKS
jgi:hypothetical protein